MSIDETTLKAVEAGARLARHFERTLAQVDLTLPQFRLLLHLEKTPDVARDLAKKAQIKPPSLTALADGLANRGLLERIPDELDRRRVHLIITDKGHDALAQGRAAAALRLDDIIGQCDGSADNLVSALAAWVEPLNAWRDAHA